jgi:serine/threonine-protein kinase
MDTSLQFLIILPVTGLVIAIALGIWALTRRPPRKASGIAAGVLAALAIVGFVVYILSIQSPRAPVSGSLYYLLGSEQGLTLQSASAATGAFRWKYAVGFLALGPQHTPLINHGVIYLVGFTSAESATTDIHALRASDGQPLWTTSVAGSIYKGNHQSQQPLAIANGIVYVTTDAGIFAFRATDGRQVWNAALNGGACSPAQVADGVVYVTSSTADTTPNAQVTTIYALDASTGAPRWKYPTQAQNLRILTLGNGVVYAASIASYAGPHELYALNMAKGTVRWQYTQQYGVYALTPTAGALYVDGLAAPDGSLEYQLEAFDAVTGDKLWQTPQEGPPDDQLPIVLDGVAYLLTSKVNSPSPAVVKALDARYGKQLWQTTLDDNSATYVSVVGDTVYVAGNSVYALRARDGRILWRYDQPATFYQPVVSGQVVFIASTDRDKAIYLFPFAEQNYLSALDTRTGKLYWRITAVVGSAPLVA